MSSQTFAFLHANIIPMDEERMVSDQTLIVQNGQITEIGDAAHIPVPSGAIQIDAAGKFLLPAFADMPSISRGWVGISCSRRMPNFL